MIPAGVVLCLVVPALAVAYGPQNTLRSYFSAAEPSVIWELAIGGFVVACFLTSIGLWMLSTVGSSRVDLQACKLEYSIVSPK